ncbi:hypothetical protein [Vibrio lentus]|uniref:hypothetical protein n=1 Tax=Vibrio lentus TaxID=136468 RepID=UPI001F53B816|nr:hypothetical protein [Vibrio lentus]
MFGEYFCIRKLKIDTYCFETGELEDSLTVPLGMARLLVTLLPKNTKAKFDENGEQLEALVNALKDAKAEGILLELKDDESKERIVFSVA